MSNDEMCPAERNEMFENCAGWVTVFSVEPIVQEESPLHRFGKFYFAMEEFIMGIMRWDEMSPTEGEMNWWRAQKRDINCLNCGEPSREMVQVDKEPSRGRDEIVWVDEEPSRGEIIWVGEEPRREIWDCLNWGEPAERWSKLMKSPAERNEMV